MKTPHVVRRMAVAMLATALQEQQKRPFERADQPPVHSYAITKAPHCASKAHGSR